MYMFRTVAEYILIFGRVPRQPRIISRSAAANPLYQKIHAQTSLIALEYMLLGLAVSPNPHKESPAFY